VRSERVLAGVKIVLTAAGYSDMQASLQDQQFSYPDLYS
jgi:hypothetical protein